MNLDLLIQRSVALLQANAPADGKPYRLQYSGGKDSDAIKTLAGSPSPTPSPTRGVGVSETDGRRPINRTARPVASPLKSLVVPCTG